MTTSDEARRAQRRWRISLGFMVFAVIVMTIGLVKIADTQADIKHEAQVRTAEICTSFNELRGAVEGVIVNVTKPASLEALTPERVPVVERLNRDRAAYRELALADYPRERRCR